MSAGTSLALEKVFRRSFPRYPVKVPLDVIALRSGVPQNLPGRCADLSEGGVGAMVAGELSPGQQVAIELRLPNVGLPVRTRAVVRYQGAMRCGFEFVGLSAEQREMIRYWAHRLATESTPLQRALTKREPPRAGTPATASPQKIRKVRIRRPPISSLLLAAVAMIALGAAGWWQWERSWRDLERGLVEQASPLHVSADVMAKRIVSKVAPLYPEEARRTGTQGMVVLDTVIAADGSIKRLQPISGDDVLAQAAMDAVRQWKFDPYRSASRAIEVETTIAIEFRLN
jgi:TonB family protein